jgi:hypothetical protein
VRQVYSSRQRAIRNRPCVVDRDLQSLERIVRPCGSQTARACALNQFVRRCTFSYAARSCWVWSAGAYALSIKQTILFPSCLGELNRPPKFAALILVMFEGAALTLVWPFPAADFYVGNWLAAPARRRRGVGAIG